MPPRTTARGRAPRPGTPAICGACAVGPREADARAHVQLVRHVVVAHAEASRRRVERRLVEEPVAVEPHAVLELEVAALPPRVAEREPADELADVALATRELPRELRRPSGREIGERVEGEGAEQVRRLVLRTPS